MENIINGKYWDFCPISAAKKLVYPIQSLSSLIWISIRNLLADAEAEYIPHWI